MLQRTIQSGPLIANGQPPSAEAQAQPDQGRNRRSDCTCWSPQRWQWLTNPSCSSSQAAGRRWTRTAVRNVRPSLKLNKGVSPRPLLQAARASTPTCNRNASSQLAGWLRAAAPSRRMAAERSWPVGERPSVLARYSTPSKATASSARGTRPIGDPKASRSTSEKRSCRAMHLASSVWARRAVMRKPG